MQGEERGEREKMQPNFSFPAQKSFTRASLQETEKERERRERPISIEDSNISSTNRASGNNRSAKIDDENKS